MNSERVGNLNFIVIKITALTYINVLWKNLLSSAKKFGLEKTFHFQQNINTRSKLLWSLRHGYSVMFDGFLVTNLQSPDLNPMENSQMELEAQIQKMNITNKNSLKETLIIAWNNINRTVTKKNVGIYAKTF